MKKSNSSGFSLLELMITVGILSLLLGIGIPSFTAAIRQNRLASQTNSLLAALATARSEALKRGERVTLCASNAGQTDCSGTNDWATGWIVFVDSEGAAGTVDADGTAPDDMVLQRWAPASQDNIGINTGTGGATRITYRGDGRTDMGVGASSNFDLVPTNCTADIRARRINVTSVGRAQFTKVNCP